MKPIWILICTLAGFPIVYFVPHGQWLVPAFWTIYSIVSILRDRRKTIKIQHSKKASFNTEDCKEVYSDLMKAVGNDERKARNWLVNYSPGLKGIPAEMLHDIEGRVKVKNFLSFYLRKGL